MILKRVALATAAVTGGVSVGVWALPKLRRDEVYILYSFNTAVYIDVLLYKWASKQVTQFQSKLQRHVWFCQKYTVVE